MSTSSTKIRPRVRSAAASNKDVGPAHSAAPAVVGSGDGKELPPLVVLARIPEVAATSEGRTLSARLEWVRNLDWQRLGRLKLDPNWVAGGVLSVVLLLLLVITFNRSSKNEATGPSAVEAPAWNASKAAAPSAIQSPVENATVDVEHRSVLTVDQPSASPNIAPNAVVETNSPLQPQSAIGPPTGQVVVQTSLDGIAYPQTPFPTIAAPTSAAATVGANYQPRGEELRTASRDGFGARPGQFQGSQPQYPAARLEGIITQP